MHALEYALLILSHEVKDEELAAKFEALASCSHNYLPPERPELDVTEKMIAEIRAIEAARLGKL